MADSKITGLAALTTADPANDMLPIVDVSDNSMAASGTTKRISINNILACSPSATLASATISGDLTVDTNVLKVDTTNNVVGIGTTTPNSYAFNDPAKLVIANDGTAGAGNTFSIVSGSTGFGNIAFANGTSGTARFNGYIAYNHSSNFMAFYTNAGAERYRLGSDGTATWSVGGSTAMTLNSTGLGVGEAASVSRLQARGSTTDSSAYVLYGKASSGNVICFMRNDGRFLVGNGTTDNFIVTETGQVGIGVTPSAGKGCLQLSSGINFPATQVASSDVNTLDDYEEGTWTIGLTFGGGSTGITTATNTGRYTKIGRQVTVSGNLSLSNKGSSTGIAEIQGLPFTIANSNEAYSAANVRFNGVSFADIPISIGAIGSTKILLQEITKAGVVTDITDADFTNTSSCIIGFTYTV
jgi:hypothetical protein